MEVLKNLAAQAVSELRRGTSTEHLHLRDFVNCFNTTISEKGAWKPGSFDEDFWIRIARAMDENTAEIRYELVLWLADIGGKLSLLVVACQQKAPRDHLLRTALSLCDALELVRA